MQIPGNRPVALLNEYRVYGVIVKRTAAIEIAVALVNNDTWSCSSCFGVIVIHRIPSEGPGEDVGAAMPLIRARPAVIVEHSIRCHVLIDEVADTVDIEARSRLRFSHRPCEADG